MIYTPQHFYHGTTAPSRPRPPHCRGFMITLRHTTLGRTPLDGWSARRRYLYLTTHNIHKRQTSMHPAAFKHTISASEQTQTHVIDRVTTSSPPWSVWILIVIAYLFKQLIYHILCIPHGYNVLVYLCYWPRLHECICASVGWLKFWWSLVK